MTDSLAAAITSSALDEWSAHDAAAAMTQSFEDYVVPVTMDAVGFARRFGAEDVDRFLSRIYRDGDRLVGIGVVCRRGRTARIGAFGCTPAYRGRGVARALMDDLLQRVGAADAERVVLEVITANRAAVRLYERLGFEPVRRLVGYTRDGTDHTVNAPALDEVDPVRVSRALGRYGLDDPPWQLAPETVAAAVPPCRAFSLNDRAFALVTPGAEAVGLSALVVHPDVRRRGYGTRLLAGLRAVFPGRRWSIAQIVPDDVAVPFFAAAGWARHDLEQVEMSRDVTTR